MMKSCIHPNCLKRMILATLPFSVGDARDIDVNDDESLTLDDTESNES